MPVTNALDYSFDHFRIDPGALAKAGIKAVYRYLWTAGSAGSVDKGIGKGERHALHNAGLGIVFGFEAGAGDWRGGTTAGMEHGARARTYAAQLGIPAGTPIYYSIDSEIVDAAHMAKAVAYLNGADDRTHPARAYGQASVIDTYGKPGFQTYAWSHGKVSPHAALYQFANGQRFGQAAVDHCEIRDRGKLGAWWPTTTPAKPSKPVPPIAERMYTVQAGDTLTSIAAHYKVDWRAIYNHNRRIIGPDANHIHPGQKLSIPR